ncbi:MAG: PLP-dependent aminotransferase family protein [Clostridia bacterium]|nr:PLP-dependent aminotransferase family protein [Clostridia bacterium]MBQ1435066.1 PLP-dependent aminotransferase family protein [Clostridia bacterium]MBQ4250173.1 PLP-dependent aminotransferase family protein [Clostridia bacterium]
MNYAFSDKINPLKPSAIREILKYASNPDIIPFAAGNPASESFPVEIMAKISADIYANDPIPALQYGISEGYAPLIADLKARNKSHFNIGRDFDDTVILSGATQAMDLSTKILCNEGDVVICESPSFIGSLNVFRSYNTKLVGVPMDDDGMNIEALEAAIKANKNVRFVYTIPTFQNPSGKTMPLHKRKAMYEICKKYGVLILEDNPYGELRFAGEDVPTIKSFDEDGIVIYVGSFSKTLSSGIRLGFCVAPKPIIAKMTVAKQCSDVHTNMFFQILAHKFLTEYDFDAQVKKVQSIYGRKSKLMLDGAKAHFDSRVKVVTPEGGLFVWCEMPEGTDITKLTKAALDRKVAIVPGSAFLVDTSEESFAIRLNYSTPSDEQIVRGMEILGEVIKEELK